MLFGYVAVLQSSGCAQDDQYAASSYWDIDKYRLLL
jgi:hypothetical protein